jgi:response regulator RpfG family c-di-GMP phosphodiesterase
MSKKINLLYVDDEFINLQLFGLNLRRNYTIITADSGAKALEILKNNPEIDIVISDMKMPQMNGLEFIKIAKEKHSKIKCFILTGYDVTNEIQNAIKTGIILKYFRKPFNIPEIVESIDQTINLD